MGNAGKGLYEADVYPGKIGPHMSKTKNKNDPRVVLDFDFPGKMGSIWRYAQAMHWEAGLIYGHFILKLSETGTTPVSFLFCIHHTHKVYTVVLWRGLVFADVCSNGYTV